jgi:4-amino-4-deoxy-L-arabinose transferase-like glycosyltransferase
VTGAAPPNAAELLSVVVPAYDEAPNLERLVSEVRDALDAAGVAWELIVVDDGSGDETPAVLAALVAKEPRLRPIHHATRRGQTAAIATGFGAARGELIATLDADLQCRPEELPRLLAALGDADAVCGVRVGRQDPGSRRLASMLANGARRMLLAPRLRDLACPARVMRASALARLADVTPLFDGAHRWLPALFELAGLRVAQVPLRHWPRHAGVSKYTTRGRLGPIARETVRVAQLTLRRSWRRRAFFGAVVLVLVATPYVYALGRWPLIEPDEGRNAEVAREMLELGRWSVPHFNQIPYLDKPTMLFWLIAGSYKVMGVNEFAARLPAAVSAVATVGLTWVLARRLVGGPRAALAAAIVATAPLVLVFARLAIFDMPFTAFVTLALWCLVRARLDGGAGWLVPLAGLAMAAATLTKGPVGAALPLLSWLAGRGALPPPRERTPPRALLLAGLLFVVAVGSWIAVVLRHEPGFLRYALIDETFLRFTSVARFRRGGAVYLYPLTLVWALAPWSVVLVGVVPELVRCWRLPTADGTAVRFATRVAVTMIVFFTLSASKRPQYILPALVPLAIVCAVGIARGPERAAGALRACALGAVVGGSVLAVAAFHGLHLEGAERSAASASVLMAGGLVLVAWGAFTLAIHRTGAWPTIACATLLSPGAGLVLLGALAPWVDVRSARTLAARVPPDAKVVAFQQFRTSLPFYLRRPVPLLSTTAGELTSNYICANRGRFAGGPNLARPAALRTMLANGEPLYVVTRQSKLDQLAEFSGGALRPVDADARSVLLRR